MSGVLALLLLALGTGSAPARGQESRQAAGASAADDAPKFDEKRVRRAWGTLWPSERHDAIEWLRVELSRQDTFQQKVLRWALAFGERDPGLWPELGAPPMYDARTHAPAQPIERRLEDAGSTRAQRERRRFLGEPDEHALLRQWVYDWPSGEVRRVALGDPVEIQFENALRGFPPELDLACALVERALDDGRERSVLAAFGHAYSDRSGNVLPGVTLFDVWRSGETFETPDVEALGIVHDVLGEWKRWRAPVSDQNALYDQLGELFQRANRYRGLRTALADVYAMSAPPNRDGYEATRHRLHALWEHALSEPETLAPLLPGAPDWKGFLEAWDRTCKKDEELSAIAVGREQTLGGDEEQVRRTLAWVLRELGAFERKSRPSQDPAARAVSAADRRPSDR